MDLYKQKLRRLGYQEVFHDDEIGDEPLMRRTAEKNAPLYRLLFASKHPLGNKFLGPPSLVGTYTAGSFYFEKPLYNTERLCYYSIKKLLQSQRHPNEHPFRASNGPNPPGIP